MKIISHNINGLNAYVKNGKLEKILKEDADIYCFQEVKCADENKIRNLFGNEVLEKYNIYNSINTFKKGYAGVTILVKKEIEVKTAESITPSNDNLSGYSEGRLYVLELNDVIILNIYSVNSAGEQKTKDRLLYELWLADFVKLLQKIKPIIICGDLNVCGTELDYWGNYEKARDSGPGLMTFEINLFKALLITNNLIDGFRYIHEDERKYSWFTNGRKKDAKQPWESRHGWRLDYFLLSNTLKDKINDCDIYEAWNHVDHSPIVLEIK